MLATQALPRFLSGKRLRSLSFPLRTGGDAYGGTKSDHRSQITLQACCLQAVGKFNRSDRPPVPVS
ncbi:MAG: hypothetical protein ACYTXA_15565 [Nostoc sp.]